MFLTLCAALAAITATAPSPLGLLDALGVGAWAIGFAIEVTEIERVVRPGGVALHLTGMPFPMDDDPLHERLLGSGYEQGSYEEGEALYCKYFREF